MFEYIGEMGRDYIYTVAPLLEDALMDRDLVHRQTAASVVIARDAGAWVGLGCEDVLQHLLNYVWPNIFEESPPPCQRSLWLHRRLPPLPRPRRHHGLRPAGARRCALPRVLVYAIVGML